MFAPTLSQVTAEACVPEQLVHYVRAVSGRRAFLCRGYVAYAHEGQAVLTAYPGSADAGPFEEAAALYAAGGPAVPPFQAVSLAEALEELSQTCSSLTVLSPFLPAEAPTEAAAAAKSDCYWQLPLPAPKPGVKLRNMLARAGREISLHQEGWNNEHAALVSSYLATRPLAPGTRALFQALPAYIEGAPPASANVLLLAARRFDGSLAGFAVGDYTGLHTAFYMFAFRRPDAPPGTADLLLSGLARHAQELGHSRLNLGLGINGGISFFKKKWGALPYLPYVECSWQLRRKGLLGRLFG